MELKSPTIIIFTANFSEKLPATIDFAKPDLLDVGFLVKILVNIEKCLSMHLHIMFKPIPRNPTKVNFSYIETT